MSKLKVDEIRHSDDTTTTEPSIPALDKRMASAWVNFDGTGTVAIRDGYNVSSITDNNTGNYTVTFSTNLSDSNYAAGASCGQTNQNSVAAVGAQGTTSCLVTTVDCNGTSSFTDMANIGVAIFGGK